MFYVSCTGRPVFTTSATWSYSNTIIKKGCEIVCVCVCVYIQNIKKTWKKRDSLNCDNERNVDYKPGFISDSAWRSYKKQVF